MSHTQLFWNYLSNSSCIDIGFKCTFYNSRSVPYPWPITISAGPINCQLSILVRSVFIYYIFIFFLFISVCSQYVTEYECTNTNDGQWFVRDASKSFPSGHSSTAFYEAIFLIWYLQARSPRIRSKLLIPTVQSILLLLALFCSVSRITDHRHHWWDVLAGANIGILFASLTVRFEITLSIKSKGFQECLTNRIQW